MPVSRGVTAIFLALMLASGAAACGSDDESERDAALLRSTGNGCGPAGTTTLVPKTTLRIGSTTIISLQGRTVKTASLVPEGPSGVFRTPCNNHDACYGRWQSSRAQCDSTFLTEMRARCSSAACRATAKAYYEAVSRKGAEAFTKAQANTGRNRTISIRIASKPPAVATSPFARFIVYPVGGASNPIICELDGIPRSCPPAPLFTVNKGTHRISFIGRNNRGTVRASYTWRVK